MGRENHEKSMVYLRMESVSPTNMTLKCTFRKPRRNVILKSAGHVCGTHESSIEWLNDLIMPGGLVSQPWDCFFSSKKQRSFSIFARSPNSFSRVDSSRAGGQRSAMKGKLEISALSLTPKLKWSIRKNVQGALFSKTCERELRKLKW